MKRRDILAYAGVAVPAATIGRLGTELEPSSGKTVGRRQVVAVRATLDAFRAADEAHGGGIGRRAVGIFLSSDIAALCHGRFADASVRADAFNVAAQAAYLAAWKAHDVGEEGWAQKYYEAARTLAVESGTPGHESFILRALAMQAADSPVRASTNLAYAQAADDAAGDVRGHAKALMQVTVARAHAEAGNAAAARRMLAKAQAHLDTDSDPDTPDFVSAWCPHKANLLNQVGHVLSELGEWAEAAQYHQVATAIWNPETHARVKAMDGYLVGRARWHSGDSGGAEDAWRVAVNGMAAVDSARCQLRIGEIGQYMPHLTESVV